jgi:hypothetical protein
MAIEALERRGDLAETRRNGRLVPARPDELESTLRQLAEATAGEPDAGPPPPGGPADEPPRWRDVIREHRRRERGLRRWAAKRTYPRCD